MSLNHTQFVFAVKHLRSVWHRWLTWEMDMGLNLFKKKIDPKIDVDWTKVLLREIATPSIDMYDVARTYSTLINNAKDANARDDCERVNAAIVARWGVRGLRKIKRLAWRRWAEHALRNAAFAKRHDAALDALQWGEPEPSNQSGAQ